MTIQNFIYTFLIKKKKDFLMKCLLLALMPLFIKAFARAISVYQLLGRIPLPNALEVGCACAMVCITTYPDLQGASS
jgi:hypothetical protein